MWRRKSIHQSQGGYGNQIGLSLKGLNDEALPKMCYETPFPRVCCEVASQDHIITKWKKKRFGTPYDGSRKKNLENSSHTKISLF